MLAIRMQRTGRSGHAQFRVVVQDSRFSPTSGRVVEYLGSYNPHTKATTLDKEKAQTYLSNGAQPSERVAKLLETEGVKLPKWVAKPDKKERQIRNAEKLRRNRPAEESPAEATSEEATQEPAVEAAQEAQATNEADDTAATTENEAPAESSAEPADAEAPAEPADAETPTK